jgi:hypothetical protein
MFQKKVKRCIETEEYDAILQVILKYIDGSYKIWHSSTYLPGMQENGAQE